jgi:hypothetical protein
MDYSNPLLQCNATSASHRTCLSIQDDLAYAMTPFSQPSVFRKTPTKNVLNFSIIIQQTPLHPPPIILQTINLEEIPTVYFYKYSTSKFNNTKDKHPAVQAERSTLSTI